MQHFISQHHGPPTCSYSFNLLVAYADSVHNYELSSLIVYSCTMIYSTTTAIQFIFVRYIFSVKYCKYYEISLFNFFSKIFFCLKITNIEVKPMAIHLSPATRHVCFLVC